MKLFFTFLVIAVLSVCVLCHPQDPEMLKHVEECNKQHNVSPKEFKEFVHGKSSTPPENLKCSMHCTMVKQGIMDEAGVFNADAAKAKNNEFSAFVDDCKDETGSSPCETAFQISECMKSRM